MATTTIVRITHPETTAQLGEFLGEPATAPREACLGAARYLRALSIGSAGGATVTIGEDDSVAASATATLSSTVATDSLTINGVAFAGVASNPSGNQFLIGSDDTESAANLAAKINASATAKIAGYVTASSDGAVVTITAVHAGVSGNMFTTAQSGNTITLDPDTGFLAGGAERTTPTSYSL